MTCPIHWCQSHLFCLVCDLLHYKKPYKLFKMLQNLNYLGLLNLVNVKLTSNDCVCVKEASVCLSVLASTAGPTTTLVFFADRKMWVFICMKCDPITSGHLRCMCEILWCQVWTHVLEQSTWDRLGHVDARYEHPVRVCVCLCTCLFLTQTAVASVLILLCVNGHMIYFAFEITVSVCVCVCVCV